jgi:tetratricopeptide (TPR) repeat protein
LSVRATRSTSAASSSRGPRLGERLRQLRVSAGLTQTDLAGDRFSKEYISQIERGKTRPTQETVDWLAARLRVDASFLSSGVSADGRARAEALLARADALAADKEYTAAVDQYSQALSAVLGTGAVELHVRVLSGEAWARAHAGEVRPALQLLEQARGYGEGPEFSDVDRADILFRLGVCRYKLSSIATSVALFDQALQLAERSGLPCDLLRSEILNWRSRCRRRQRDYEAAREDVERALELAEGLEDKRMTAHVYFQASLIAEREGHWVTARNYAERARSLYADVEDQADVGRLLNNLGGLSYLLHKPDDALRYLKDAFKVLIDIGRDEEAATAVSSLAQVHLGTGELATAEEQARHALVLMDGREDRLDEIGNAQLVLGRSLLEQGRLDEAETAFDEAENTFEKFESTSHRAAVWIAKGDLTARRGDDTGAARLYRRAAETLQDFRF